MTTAHTWALVLAAGEGTRLSTLTSDGAGVNVPKQFCSLTGRSSLLQLALERGRSVAPRERTCVIVAEQHRHWWEAMLSSLPAPNVIVQPRNRGTANGILLPLLCILARDPQARIVVLPSDHYVGDEAVLGRSLHAAVSRLPAQSQDLVMLGIAPEDPDPELGYVIPEPDEGSEAFPVRCFVEKPERAVAERLIKGGALWNSFIFTASGRGLLNIFRRRCAEIVPLMREALGRSAAPHIPSPGLRDLYQRLPGVDFSRHVLQHAAERLRVWSVPRCGWTDLGTVHRVAKTVYRLPAAAPPAVPATVHYDLGAAVRHRFPGLLTELATDMNPSAYGAPSM